MPVYSSHLLAYAELSPGRRIRDARQRRGWTLRQLAARVGTSTARLSQIENDAVHVDVLELQKIAELLDAPLEALVPADVRVPYHIERSGSVPPRWQRLTLFARSEPASVPAPHRYALLASLFVGRHLEPMLGRIAPVPERDLLFACHDEEEFAFALRGAIEFRLKTPEGERVETLARGDCVYFRSDLPHAFRSLEPDGSDTLHVLCSPSPSTEGPIDGAFSRAIACDDAEVGATDVRRLVGRKLRLLREVRGWSLERLARSAGLTERFIAGLERGERGVPLDAMLSVARAFGRPLRELISFAVLKPPYHFVRRSHEIPSLPSRRRRTPVERPHAASSKTCQPLVSGFPAQEMYPYFLRMLNVNVDTLALHEHCGQEFIYVLDGDLELTTHSGGREVRETLRAGDSCYLDSSVPHLLRSWTRNPYSETSAQVIDVFWCPLGEAYLFDERPAATAGAALT